VKRGPLADARVAAGTEAEPVGRASRRVGSGIEVYIAPASDERVGDRLLALGAAGVGGFVDGGVDDEGVWLVRDVGGRTLGEQLRERKGPWASAEAIDVAVGVARALAACEKANLFPGPLSPEGIRRDATGRVALPANALISGLLGKSEPLRAALSSVSPKWSPPAQADGAVWDGEANRYVLGLLLYRMLSGEHPFRGAGLRHALGEAAHGEAPPFVESVAAALPSGLQGLTLRLLDPDPASRPRSAEAIVAELGRFAAGAAQAEPQRRAETASAILGRVERASNTRPDARPAPIASARAERASADEAAPKRPRAAPERGAPPWVLRLWPLGAGAAIALASLALLGPAPPKPAAPEVPAEAPLSAANTTAQDCARCHARQAGEWRRSVMAHAVKSPLFNALESLIQEQVGREDTCPNGAGILRKADPARACRDPKSGVIITGSGGEHWCVNCHSPMEKLDGPLPTWDGRPGGDARSRLPVKDLLTARAAEGISCAFCHQVHGPVGGRSASGYKGNPTWTSFVTGATFEARPEDRSNLFGIGNSGYQLAPEAFLLPGSGAAGSTRTAGGAHLRPDAAAAKYLASSEFCGSCHDVRLFGTDTLGGPKGEHFKRLRNAYTEWAAWARDETRAGRPAATCQDCHMSAFPGTCEPGPGPNATDPDCPPGTHFVARAPGTYPRGRVAENSQIVAKVATHYFSGVDLPLSSEFAEELVDEPTIDAHGVPLSARKRRDMLLRHTFRFAMNGARRAGQRLEIPIEIENKGAGHRVPAGFSQEREFWVHLVVKDGADRTVYEVGRVSRADEDLRDKVFERVNTNPSAVDGKGRPVGLFGADVRDGPDLPVWTPPPHLGGTSFRGRGLVNFQNGFLRCVRCVGTIGPDGHCEAGPGQERRRADRFADGDYDPDTGACRSNLSGLAALFETYFPVGALDASRGFVKGPDAIIDTRSAPPGVPIRYTYDLPTNGASGPFKVEARLLFRAFPPFLIRAFAEYEREQARRGLRPSGPLVTLDMLKRLEIVEIARLEASISG
jgi:eukaryotic-like serine/threonine-protein kinase